MKMLKIAKNLELPDEAVTQTFAILAKRGVGKTYTASVMVEEMLKNKLPVVVLDPIGVWWGLRSSADGKKPGFSIIIAGGDHADVPITPDSGTIMANLVIDEKLSVVIDLSLFRKGEQTRFVTDFAETLYHRNRTALHVVADEADAFAPQRPMPGEQRMLGAMEDLVRRGRARGIGMTLITQRPSVLNKNVLTQVEVIVALRLIAPQDRKALDEWVKIHAEEDQREEFMQSLPSLEIGEAWFWSPGWLNIFTRIQVRKRETLDSSSTPKVGTQKVQPRNMADVNLEALRDKLAETIERVEADDPKTLKRQVAYLKQQLASKKPEIKEVPYIPEAVRLCMERVLSDYHAMGNDIIMLRNNLKDAGIEDLHVHEPESDKPVEKPLDKTDFHPAPDKWTLPDISTDGAPQPRPPMIAELSNYGRSLLETLRDRHPMKLTRSQISTMSGRKPRSSAFSSAMAEIAKLGLVRKAGDQFELTDIGHKIVGTAGTNPQTPDEIREMWLNALPSYESDLLKTLIQFYPAAVSRQVLSEHTGRSITSSAFHSSLSSLSKNELIEVTNGEVRASDNLF
jgi:hypothetical protein